MNDVKKMTPAHGRILANIISKHVLNSKIGKGSHRTGVRRFANAAFPFNSLNFICRDEDAARGGKIREKSNSWA